jgi:nucleotide-binding universal stress UspA family protein
MSSASIVCGLDGSVASREALWVAHRLGERLGLRLVLVHVLPVPLVAAFPQVAFEADVRGLELEVDGKAGRKLLKRTVRKAGLDVDAAPRIEFGEPAERLGAVAEAEDADLIVIASRRRSAWNAALHGSVTAALLSRATRPVLVVPVGAPERSD